MAPHCDPSHVGVRAYAEVRSVDDGDVILKRPSSCSLTSIRLGGLGLLALGLVAAGAVVIVSPTLRGTRRALDDAKSVTLERITKQVHPEWRIVNGDNQTYPEVQLSLGGEFLPFQLRGFDYSPVGRCCGNNDASTFHRATYTQDIPRMAAMGANAIKLYGMCDGVLDGVNLCGPPEVGCDREKVTVDDVLAFLDFCFEYKIFVLLASRNGPGDVAAYEHIASSYGWHPAVAGAIIFDETLDLANFNAAAKAVHEGFCTALGKDPATTAVENCGRIITTAAQMQIPQRDFQSKYGRYVNSWGFDPYAEMSYSTNLRPFPGLPYKPYFLMESGISGAGNAGCRDDCPPCPSCDLLTCKCVPCTCLAAPWKEYVRWLSEAPIAGVFVFEWTDENWKGGATVVGGSADNWGPEGSNAFCLETTTADDGPGFNEANHGIFARGRDGSLVAKSLGAGESFESVLRASWAAEAPGFGGFRGWLRPGTWLHTGKTVDVPVK